MFKVFSFLILMAYSVLVYGQGDEYTDEFEINEEAVEINPSLEDPYKNSDILEGLETPSATADMPASNPPEPEPVVEENTENTVLVREKVIPQNEAAANETGLVEVRSSRDIFLPYKQRQNDWGFGVSLGAELATFPNLISQFDENTFSDLFGSDGIALHAIELGPKYNMSFGSLGLYFGYGDLSASDSRIGERAEINIKRYTATLIYYVDTIWSEPYLIPYIGGGAWQADYTETTESEPDTTYKYTTEVGYHWRLGALIGLDWIEPNTALRSRRHIGLQATFLNLYATSSYMSESEPDPDLENEMDFGASLLLEF